MSSVVVHDLAQATAAARAAYAEGASLTLRSAPGAGRTLGVAGWLALVEATRVALPAADLTFSLDCADLPGDAHAALSFGAEQIALSPSVPAYGRIADIAAQQGAIMDAEAPVLDLAFIHDPEAAVRRWLRPTTA
ncbi:MAG: hypothetical protein ACKVH0_00700 [Alphaproteobacteria bacterium]